MIHDAAAHSAECASAKHHVLRTRPQSSVLTEAHNQGWATGLNMDPRPEFFAQQHSDVLGKPGWLDVLIEEIEATGAGLLAAVVPIKDDRGLSSTTVLDPATRMHRRLTMREIHALPETFAVSDVPWAPPGAVLCTNTGMWACRFDGDWVERIRFTIQDFIEKTESGLWESSFWPEDWQFAEDATGLGVKVMATRKVRVAHFGAIPFKNDRPWGTESPDNWHPTHPPFRLDRPKPAGAHLGGYAIGGFTSTWAPEVWAELLSVYEPRKVLDLGSGEGQIARWFADHGCDVLAIDGASEAVRACHERGLRAEQVDLTVQKPALEPLDMIWCSEFVEHIEERYLPNILETFDTARVVALTHAIPGDEGYHHVNCQNPDYWIALMEQRGFRYASELSDRLRSKASSKATCIRRSLLVFDREAA